MKTFRSFLSFISIMMIFILAACGCAYEEENNVEKKAKKIVKKLKNFLK